MKDVYNFKKHHFPKDPWTKNIWSKDIPPFKSLLVWRCMLNKLATDKNLSSRGCQQPSRCSLCLKNVESSFHLFFKCVYAQNIWNWLASSINYTLQFQSKEEIWSLCNRSWSPQCKVMITAALFNLFNNKQIYLRSSISKIISSTSVLGNNTKVVASLNF